MKDKPIFSIYHEPRPTLISIICITGVIFSLCNILIVLFYPDVNRELSVNLHPTVPASTLIFAIGALLAYIGIWKMRIWGLVLYSITFICAITYCFIIGHHFWWGYLFSTVVLLILLFYAKHFR